MLYFELNIEAEIVIVLGSQLLSFSCVVQPSAAHLRYPSVSTANSKRKYVSWGKTWRYVGHDGKTGAADNFSQRVFLLYFSSLIYCSFVAFWLNFLMLHQFMCFELAQRGVKWINTQSLCHAAFPRFPSFLSRFCARFQPSAEPGHGLLFATGSQEGTKPHTQCGRDNPKNNAGRGVRTSAFFLSLFSLSSFLY